MTDYPIPDDLVNKLAQAMSDQWNTTMGTGPKDATVSDDWEGDARVALAALAEWADGALLDPNGWRRYDAGHRMMTDREGNSYFTLHERTGQ